MRQKKNDDKVFIPAAKELYSRKTVYCMLLDIAFIVVAVLTVLAGASMIASNLQEFVDTAPRLMQLKADMSQSPEQIRFSKEVLEDMQEIIRRVTFRVGLTGIAMILLLFVEAALIRGIIWSMIRKNRLAMKVAARFVLVNIAWSLGWTALIGITVFLVKRGIGAYIILTLFVVMHYLTSVLYASLDTKSALWNTLMRALRNSFSRAIVVWFAFMMIAVIIFNMLAFSVVKGLAIFTLPLLLLLLLGMHWSRICYIKVIG